MKKYALLACSTAVSLLFLADTASAENDPDELGVYRLDADPRIVGAWEVEMTVRADAEDCTTAEPVGSPNPFPSLNTFHQGGTMSETGSRSPPSARGPGHGVWKHTTGNRYRAHTMFQTYDPNGFLSGEMHIKARIKLAKDGKSFTAVSRLMRSDLSGNVLLFCATQEGKRITF